MGGPGALDQLDGLVDRGVVGRRVGEQELVEAEAQGGQDRRVEAPGRPARRAGRSRRRLVAAPLDGAVGEALRLGALATAQALASRRRPRKARSVKAPSSKVSRTTSKATRPRLGDHSFGSEWPRR